MIYNFKIETLPRIEHIYTVVRNTVWQVADQYHILLIILEGECNVRLGGADHLLGEGDALFIPRSESYCRSPVGDRLCKMLYVHFLVKDAVQEMTPIMAATALGELSLDIRSSLLPERRSFPANTTDVFLPMHYRARDGRLKELGREIAELLPVFKASDALLVTLRFCEILSHITRKTVSELDRTAGDIGLNGVPQRLKKAVFYIREHEAERITLPGLAEYCGISESQLIRYFRTSLGKTPNEYIREYKINRAREIFLNAPDLPIKAVADMLGFDDMHYFSRVFRALTGEAPRDYRARVTKTDLRNTDE